MRSRITSGLFPCQQLFDARLQPANLSRSLSLTEASAPASERQKVRAAETVDDDEALTARCDALKYDVV